MRPSWFRISAVLAGLWLVIGPVLWVLENRQPSLETVLSLVQKPSAKPEDVAMWYHRLSYEHRGDLLGSPELRTWWNALSMPERRVFRELLFPQLTRVVELFDRLPADQRRRQLGRILESRRASGQEWMPGMNPLMLSTIATAGIRPFFESAGLDENIEVLRMILELEKRIVWKQRR